jgi:hypothetical protein
MPKIAPSMNLLKVEGKVLIDFYVRSLIDSWGKRRFG